MSEPFVGEVRLVGFNFAPRGWASCNGQLLSIAQNTALFSLLGTTFGGNGQTNFGLPDYRDGDLPDQRSEGAAHAGADTGAAGQAGGGATGSARAARRRLTRA